jgi:acyl-CoA dehydrogenase
VPEEVGLVGFGYSTLVFRSPFGADNGIAGRVLLEGGTPRQREEHLPWLAGGEWTASLTLTEPEAGPAPSTLATLAYGDGGDRVITGSKRCMANAARQRGVRAGPAGHPTSRGISAFLVSAGSGLMVGRRMGQAGAVTADVYLDAARVSAGRARPPPCAAGRIDRVWPGVLSVPRRSLKATRPPSVHDLASGVALG